jgi:hypothetical protein
MVGHDYVGSFADEKCGRIDAPGVQFVQLSQQYISVYHHTVADDAGDSRPTYTRGNHVKLKGAIIVDHGMASVAPAPVSDDSIHSSGKEVYNLPFAFIAPLAANHCVARHLAP